MTDPINPNLTVMLDNTDLYDAIIRGKTSLPTLKDGGDLLIITKHGAMYPSDAAGACLTFTAETPAGQLARVQTVVSVKLLLTTLRILEANYTDDGIPRLKS